MATEDTDNDEFERSVYGCPECTFKGDYQQCRVHMTEMHPGAWEDGMRPEVAVNTIERVYEGGWTKAKGPAASRTVKIPNVALQKCETSRKSTSVIIAEYAKENGLLLKELTGFRSALNKLSIENERLILENRELKRMTTEITEKYERDTKILTAIRSLEHITQLRILAIICRYEIEHRAKTNCGDGHSSIFVDKADVARMFNVRNKRQCQRVLDTVVEMFPGFVREDRVRQNGRGGMMKRVVVPIAIEG